MSVEFPVLHPSPFPKSFHYPLPLKNKELELYLASYHEGSNVHQRTIKVIYPHFHLKEKKEINNYIFC
jgi:hypothetical protein